MKRLTVIVLVNLGLLAAFFGLAEIAIRIVFPCSVAEREQRWSFVPGVGSVHEPGALDLDTNGFDHCAPQHANSLGFLDAEPPSLDAVKDKLRIALLGDSVVEASQVPIAEKVQSLLPGAIARNFGIDASVVALGISGLGEVQELALFKHFGLALHPHIVVLVIISNDIKNNSWLLQALEDGIEPETPYNVEIAPPDWRTIAPVSFQEAKLIPTGPQSPPLNPVRDWFSANSALYRYMLYRAGYNNEWLYGLLSGHVEIDDLAPKIEYLRQRPEFSQLLSGWPRDAHGNHLSMVDAFEHTPRPKVFDLAIAATEHIMDEWAALAREEHFRLIAMTRDDMGDLRAQTAMWQTILGARGIPLISGREFFTRHGFNARDEYFMRDGHWSPQGHRWAAQAIIEFLQEHPEYLEREQAVRSSSSARGVPR